MRMSKTMNQTQIEDQIRQSKDWRQRLDSILQEMKLVQKTEGRSGDPEVGRQLSISITELENAIMRQGMRLKAINEMSPDSAPNPYPESYNPESAKVEPTADGIKL